MSDSKIEWTDKTWNPTRGCSVISPGCINCYAMKLAHRFSGEGKAYHGLTKLTEHSGPQWTGKVATVESALLEPLSWRKPARVFVNSMSDLFHDSVPDAFIDRVFAVMALAPQHTFQILTKRPERMLAYMVDPFRAQCVADVVGHYHGRSDVARPLIGQDGTGHAVSSTWPLKNVWLGVSVENQHFADERIPLLLQTPAAIRFISYEPALGPVDVRRWLRSNDAVREHGSRGKIVIRQRDGLDWIIAGGESGPGARPCDLSWLRSMVEQVAATMGGTKLFMKQLGAVPTNIARPPAVTDSERKEWMRDGWTRVISSEGESFTKHPRLKDRKGGDLEEWPADLRVREFPAVRQ